jgi:hypothetical protein
MNLTTKTLKYRVHVSQLSLQCFPSFFLSLLSEKIKAHFFRKFFHVTLKNSYFEFGVEIRKKTRVKILFGFITYRQKRLCKVLNSNYTGCIKIDFFS